MTTEGQENPAEQLDVATSARLARLRTMPVDTSGLDAALKRRIPRRPVSTVRRLLRPITAVAASIALFAIVAAALLTSTGGEVLASPAQMAQVHQDILANRIPVTRVASIEEAGKALTQSWAQSPDLPEPPQTHVMACCMKSIRDKHVACVLLQDPSGTPITMSVARSADMRLPKSPTVSRGGIAYHVQSIGSLNIVMTEQSQRWVCLIAELPQDQLIDLAARLRF